MQGTKCACEGPFWWLPVVGVGSTGADRSHVYRMRRYVTRRRGVQPKGTHTDAAPVTTLHESVAAGYRIAFEPRVGWPAMISARVWGFIRAHRSPCRRLRSSNSRRCAAWRTCGAAPPCIRHTLPPRTSSRIPCPRGRALWRALWRAPHPRHTETHMASGFLSSCGAVSNTALGNQVWVRLPPSPCRAFRLWSGISAHSRLGRSSAQNRSEPFIRGPDCSSS